MMNKESGIANKAAQEPRALDRPTDDEAISIGSRDFFDLLIDLEKNPCVGKRLNIAEFVDAHIDKLLANKAAEEGELPRLDNEEIDIIWQTMPGGPANWLKGFGYQAFAKAIEDEVLLNVQRAQPDIAVDRAARAGAYEVLDIKSSPEDIATIEAVKVEVAAAQWAPFHPVIPTPPSASVGAVLDKLLDDLYLADPLKGDEIQKAKAAIDQHVASQVRHALDTYQATRAE